MAQVLDRSLEHRRRPVTPKRSKKADCGLTNADLAGERLDAGGGEPLQSLDRVGQAPVVEQRGVRVDAHARRPVRVHRRARAPERPEAHRASVLAPMRPLHVIRRSAHSCSEATSTRCSMQRLDALHRRAPGPGPW